MTLPNYRVRRATLDDLSALKALWESMRFSGADLEKGLTEFHIVESADGKLLVAIALQIGDKSGRIHSEAFTDFGLAEELRQLLWERLQVIALNYGRVLATGSPSEVQRHPDVVAAYLGS